jgi:hypothetical protein
VYTSRARGHEQLIGMKTGRVPGTGTRYEYKNETKFRIRIQVFLFVGTDTGTTRILNLGYG